MEERVYRHRCVETWSLVVPWTGFPLRKLLAAVGPLPAATFVRFETALDPVIFPAQASSPGGLGAAPWPYVEGLALAEAWNDLPFLAVGQSGGPLRAQNGAPVRLVVPHKYGFKSVKSLRRITLATERPLNWWARIAPSEYGFYANVNPAYPHPRWSQARHPLRPARLCDAFSLLLFAAPAPLVFSLSLSYSPLSAPSLHVSALILSFLALFATFSAPPPLLLRLLLSSSHPSPPLRCSVYPLWTAPLLPRREHGPGGRWQATENLLVNGPGDRNRVPTLIYNGYGAEVAHLYGTTRDYFY
jgi:hypothetical protein